MPFCRAKSGPAVAHGAERCGQRVGALAGGGQHRDRGDGGYRGALRARVDDMACGETARDAVGAVPGGGQRQAPGCHDAKGGELGLPGVFDRHLPWPAVWVVAMTAHLAPQFDQEWGVRERAERIRDPVKRMALGDPAKIERQVRG